MHGYHDRIAWIDLTKRSIDIRPIEPGDRENFIGGSNMGAAILARLTDAHTDPLGPDNPVIFMTGPFTATKAPMGSRHEVVALSPLTGIYGESNAGGAFAWRLKRSGLDGLVFTGASAAPVMLVIDGDEIRLVDAADLWGRDYYAADAAVKAKLGAGTTTAMIGPAGENQVPMACICHDGRHTRVAGRTGLGAVMGSKRLKGIAITQAGKMETPVADTAGLEASLRAARPRIQEKLKPFAALGTPGIVVGYERVGNLPINNFRDARAPELAERIGGAVLEETIQKKRVGCQRCPVVCSRTVEIPDGPHATDGAVEGPEFETLAGFGAMQLIDDLPAIAKINELCNRLGLDTISTAGVVAFANECWEKGIITGQETGGLQLGFGRPDAVIALIERIGRAEDHLGRTLGQGVRHAAEVFGGDAAECALHVKGLENPAPDPRFSWGHALGFATSNRGACHISTCVSFFENSVALPELGYDTPFPHRQRDGKAQHLIHLQNLMNMEDSLVVCRFSMINNAARLTDFLDWYTLITGRGIGRDDFLAAGARGFNLKRMINNRRGIGRKDDILPPRLRTLKKVGDDVNYDVPPVGQLLSDYYELRGWTEEGRPGREVVRQLGLEWMER
jgi:aldehyde:ferredoxin oxidoreductase